jgi:N utilization substance protein A
MKGTRVQSIIRELRGEKIDIVEWSEDSVLFVTNAISPAKVQRVSIVDDADRVMEVVVEDKQLSLAIGKKGQNVRLAAKLTGWKIDIKSEEEKRREVEAQFGALEIGGTESEAATPAAEEAEAAAQEPGEETSAVQATAESEPATTAAEQSPAATEETEEGAAAGDAAEEAKTE